jgi:hypothetical protein
MLAEDRFGPFLAAVRGAYRAARDSEPDLTADLEILLAALDGLSGARVPVESEDHAARPFAAGLGWRHWYQVDHKLPDFSQNYAHAEIVGPPGPVPCQDMRCGFILMAPHTLYPSHAHSAVELYLVLGGTAEWQRGAEPWLRRPPGAFILHASRIGHAMRTADEPLLALFAWHGVLQSDLVMPLDDV